MKRNDAAPVRARRGQVVAVVLAVGALLLGIGAVKVLAPGGAEDRPASAARLAGASPASGDTIGLDLGPVTQADVAACLAPGFAGDPAEVTVVYGVEQRTHDGSVPVMVLRNQAGQIRLCDQFGGDYPAEAPPEATAAKAVAFLSSGRRDWNCEQRTRTLRRFTMTEWLSTSPEVDALRLRFVVDGVPGPWFTTRPVDGHAHLLGWLDGPLARGARLAVQQRVLDVHGSPVTQTTLPRSQRLPGCSGGSVQIG